MKIKIKDKITNTDLVIIVGNLTMINRVSNTDKDPSEANYHSLLRHLEYDIKVLETGKICVNCFELKYGKILLQTPGRKGIIAKYRGGS